MSSVLGGCLYALAIVDVPPTDCTPLLRTLGETGADRVVLIRAPSCDGPCVWGTRSDALLAATERIAPQLIVMSADPQGRDIAPRLATRLEGAYFAEPAIHYGPHGEVVLSRATFGGTHRERVAADELDMPTVLTLTPGSYQPATGCDDAEVLSISVDSHPSAVTHLESKADPDAGLDSASIIVTAGAGCDEEAFALVQKLAEALGGQAAATRAAVRAGRGSEARMIDIAGRNVAPRLYIACGASGSQNHLAAVSTDADIVAINSDPRAPIFRVAAYGIVGDVRQVLSELIAEIGNPTKAASR